MIVVDSNVLAYLYLPGPYTQAAQSLLEQGPPWAAPVLWRSEFRNILAGCLRRKALTFAQAYAVQREAEGLMADTEYAVDSLGVMRLVHGSDCSAYDCEFIALAHQLGTRLVTMDKRILRAFPDQAVALVVH
jgi:predicted nucleic acid-binding protein